MKTNRIFTYIMMCLVFLCLSFFSIEVLAQNKHALIIGIGNYDKVKTGWSKLNAKGDLRLITETLLDQGFDENDISTLSDETEYVDKEAILSAMDQLIKEVKKGDMVVIHFSGHGQQVSDLSGDEFDRLDEAIIPRGAPSSSLFVSKGTEQSSWFDQHITDDELGEKILQALQRIGAAGHLLFILDSCHSATGTRGRAVVRGGKLPFLISESIQNVHKPGGSGFLPDLQGNSDHSDLGNFVLFAGSRAGEQNREIEDSEGNIYGSLSYAFHKVFKSLRPNETYRSVFERIRAEMVTLVPEQRAVLEGNADFRLFSGGYKQASNYYRIKELKPGKRLLLKAGYLDGFYSGTSVVFYPSGTVNPGEIEPIGKGQVETSDITSSKIVLEEVLPISDASQAVAFVTEYTYSARPLKFSLDSLINKSLINELNETLGNVGWLEFTSYDQSDVFFIYEAPNFSLLNSENGSRIASFRSTDGFDNLKEILASYDKGRLVQNLDYDNVSNRVDVKLIPVKFVDLVNYEEYDTKLFIDESGMLLAPHNLDSVLFVMEIQNTGTEDSYFNIIDIQPNGVINPILPGFGSLNKPPEEFMIKAGETVRWNASIEIYEPRGDEIFKVISSSTPLNLNFGISGVGSRGTTNPFERFFGGLYTDKMTRGPSTTPVGGDGMSTSEFSFRIVSPKFWKQWLEKQH